MPEYVKNENINYLDPTKRGHIVSYSIKSVNCLANKYGFFAKRIAGKSWAFILEKNNSDDEIVDRIWSALDFNLNLLNDKKMGGVLKILGLESARAYV